MSKEKKINDLFEIKDSNQISINSLSNENSSFSSDIQKENSKKIYNYQENKNSLKTNFNFEPMVMNNEQSSTKDNNENNLKNKYIYLKKQLSSINNKIIENNKAIEQLNNSLNKLKSEKNKKKSQVVNFLSNKESLDELYNNYIDYLKNKSKPNIKANPFENQDEDEFEILVSEIKEIDLNKFIEQTFNLIEDIFDKPNQQIKSSLKEIINKSYSKFNDEVSSSPFIDTYSIVSNFFLRISLFLSNESYGKFSETIINLFLRCLLKMNSINVKNEELINYMNTKYKEEKGKLKQQIYLHIKKDEILNKTKILFEKQIEEIILELKFQENKQKIDIENMNYNINKYYFPKVNINSVDTRNNNNLIYNSQKTSNDDTNIINNNSNEYKHKKNKEKYKVIDFINKFQKIFKEDIVESNTNYNKNFLNSNNINQSSEINKDNLINHYIKKLNENYNENINTNNLNYSYSFNNYLTNNETEKENLLEINDSNSNIIPNRIKFNTISNSKEKNENKSILYKNYKNTNIKKFNTINYHYSLKNKIINKENISHELNNKNSLYYKNNIKSENDINSKLNYIDKKNKNFNKKPQKKKLNYHYINKILENNMTVNNDINKNLKFEFAKKINYLKKFKNIHNNIQIKNISQIEPNIKYKCLSTEKKEKKLKYNFFDIYQESYKKRNNSGDNKCKNKNRLNNINLRNSIFLKNTKIIKRNSNNNKHELIIFNQKSDYKIKTDYMNDKTKSFYKNKIKFFNNNLNQKEIKNGIESENNTYNGFCGSNNKFDFSFSKNNKIIYDYKIKGKNINIKNKIKNIEKINYIKKLNYDRNKYYHCNKGTYNNQETIENNFTPNSKRLLYRREKNVNHILNKGIKKNNIYNTITESKNNTINYNKFLNNVFKNDNNNDYNKSNSKQSEKSKNKNSDKEFNSCTKPKKEFINTNYKFKKSLLLERSISSTINKILNNNIEKKNTIDLYYKSIINNNFLKNENSFNASNSLASNEKKNVKEINSYNEKNKKCRIVKIPISNLNIGKRRIKNNRDIKEKNVLLNNKEKFCYNKIKEKYQNLLTKFKKNQKETFCYFKLFGKEQNFNDKFNPLENCSIDPENLGYYAGYISFDIYSGKIKIITKIAKNQNSNNKINMKEYKLFSKINNINKSFKNEYNKIDKNLNNNSKDSSINIDLEDIMDIKQTTIMNNIVNIHRMIIKYTGQKSNINTNLITTSQRNEKKVLNLNKLIYLNEIKEIKMSQNEKIKAILCNYLSFSFLFGKNNYKTEIELIFINIEQYDLWNLFINEIVKVNENKKLICNDCKHIRGNIANGSDINEEITKIINKDNILNV